MKIKISTIIKFMFLILMITYIIFIPSNSFTNSFDAILTLFLTVILFYKTKNNLPLFMITFFIFYCNYSIVFGEYIIGGSVPITQVKNIYIYGITIRVLLIFTSILALFYNGEKRELDSYKIVPRDNPMIFYSIMFTLVLILLFGINREGDLNSYQVRISPFFEYSKLLFIFAYYYSGNSKLKKLIYILFIILFMIQDVYYGGRITTLQLGILFFVTILVEKLSKKNIIMVGVIGIIFNRAIGVYRHTFKLHNINIFNILKEFFNNYFVFDTATYAYYASATHVAASKIADMNVRIKSLREFIKSIFFGSNTVYSDVTILVGEKFFFNAGGGIISTHFYFWLGWIGVFIISFLLVFVLNNLPSRESEFQKIIYVSIIVNTPRWYLYSPNAYFRGAIFFTTLLYIVFLVLHKITTGVKLRNIDYKLCYKVNKKDKITSLNYISNHR